MDIDSWQLYLDTVFTNAVDLENYMRGNAEAAQDRQAQARLRQLRGEAGTCSLVQPRGVIRTHLL